MLYRSRHQFGLQNFSFSHSLGKFLWAPLRNGLILQSILIIANDLCACNLQPSDCKMVRIFVHLQNSYTVLATDQLINQLTDAR